MDLSERIHLIKKEKKIKSADIAKFLNMEHSNYTRLEKRGSKLTYEQIEKIAEALEVTVKYLLFGEDDNTENVQINEVQKEIEYLKGEINTKNKLLELQDIIQKNDREKAKKACYDILSMFVSYYTNHPNSFASEKDIQKIADEILLDPDYQDIINDIKEKNAFLWEEKYEKEKNFKLYQYQALLKNISVNKYYRNKFLIVYKEMLLKPFDNKRIITLFSSFCFSEDYSLGADLIMQPRLKNHYFYWLNMNEYVKDDFLMNICKAYDYHLEEELRVWNSY